MGRNKNILFPDTETQAEIKWDTDRRSKQIQSNEREIRLWSLQSAEKFEGLYVYQFTLDATLATTHITMSRRWELD